MTQNNQQVIKERLLEALAVRRLVGTHQYYELKLEFRELDPYKDAPYPLNRVGTLLRIVKEFQVSWVDYIGLEIKIREKNPELFKGIGHPDFQRVLKHVCYDIGTSSYTPEWLDIKTQRHLENINNVAEAVVAANRIIPASLEHRVKKFFKENPQGILTVCDVGVGVGDTCVGVVDLFDRLSQQGFVPKNYEDHLRFVLLDVMPRSLEITYDRLSKNKIPVARNDGFSRPVRNVYTIESNFVDLNSNLNTFNDQVDIIISGGSIMHNTNVDPFFRTMHDLLNNNGILFVWDWGNYSWAAPNLRLGQFKAQIKPDLYQITQEDVQAVYDNFALGWMGDGGLFGYSGAQYEYLREKLRQDFIEGLNSSSGFNFIKWLEENLAGVQEPQEKTPYHLIEGYGPGSLYRDALKRAGFSHARDFSFRAFYESKKHLIGMQKPAEDVALSSSLFFAVGVK